MVESGIDCMTQPSQNRRPGGKRDTFNPYRVAFSLFFRRLCWDLTISSWKHRVRLQRLRNRYRGERAVILCNGPSLNDVDFSQLGSVFTIGLNKVNLLTDKTGFTPSAIVAVNPFVIQQNLDFFNTTSVPLFISTIARKYGFSNPSSGATLIHCSDFPYFSRDCSLSVFEGFTVTYVALQLAYHLGFSRVALVGCDHNYYQEGEPNVIIKSPVGSDPGHFSEEYFSGEDEWQYPDLLGSEYFYDLAMRCFHSDHRAIVNASTRSDLTVFPRISLEEFLK